jgi:hypothetical protein
MCSLKALISRNITVVVVVDDHVDEVTLRLRTAAPNRPIVHPLGQWYSTFFVRVPPDIISLQLCTPKVVGT